MKIISVIYIILCQCSKDFCGEVQPYYNVHECAGNDYFSPRFLKCLPCESSKYLLPTYDRLSCTCNGSSKIVEALADFPRCEPCPKGKVPTFDKQDCIACNSFHVSANLTICNPCSIHQIQVDKYENGSLRSNRTCINCAPNSIPSSNKLSCISCNAVFGLPGSNCSCPTATHEAMGGVCMAHTMLADFPDDKATYTVETLAWKKMESLYLRQHLRRAVYLCKLKNETACQAVANMCAMVLYQDDHKASPCRLFKEARHIPTTDNGPLPWLFYGDGDASTVLTRKKIVMKYSLDHHSQRSVLNMTVASYNPNGQFMGLHPLRGSLLQLCPGSWLVEEQGLRFGLQFRHTCSIPASQLLVSSNNQFFDLYLQYWDATDSYLYALPVLVLNMVSHGKLINEVSDQSQWQLVRRFFMVDKLIGVKPDQSSPAMVRYVKNIQLRVHVRDSSEEGRIYPPLVVVEYGELNHEDIQANKLVSLAFSTDYRMDNNFYYAIEVSMAVLSALAIVWSSLETWSVSRRSGRSTIDLLMLGRVMLFSCGHLASVFFSVVACACMHSFIFYKGQSTVHVLLPSPAQEQLVINYVISAFVLKVVQVVHMIWHQVTIDIFFIDWERPQARSSVGTLPPASNTIYDPGLQPVSMWRTYFVGNEWNEIQTSRRISLVFQLLCTLFLLEVVGLKYWASSDPELHLSRPDYMQQSQLSVTCRFSVGIMVYILVYVIQWLYTVGIYERYIKNEIHSFVDICSMSNISVFIMAWENYGFYIHGRSAHGFADTDMQTMLRQLQREEEDLCGHRGLLPGSDHQTFEMAVPFQLREYYRKVMSPITETSQVTKRLSLISRTRLASNDLDVTVPTYRSMNKFLAAYLEHALRDIDYEVTEKMCMESLLDIEFTETAGKGIFYIDNGHSFDKIIFYGNEFMLASFELIMFAFIDLMCQNFLLAAILVAVFEKTLVLVRRVCGRKNLAKKTLIDERFLI